MALLKPKNPFALDQPSPDLDPFVLNGLDESLSGVAPSSGPAALPAATESPDPASSNLPVYLSAVTDDFVLDGSNAQVADAPFAASAVMTAIAVNNPFDPAGPAGPADPVGPINNPFDPVDPDGPVANPSDPGLPFDPNVPVNNPGWRPPDASVASSGVLVLGVSASPDDAFHF
jgi:hypothetical protein